MEQINTFIKGMDKDTSDSFIDSQRYRHLENGDILYDSGEDSGVLVDIKGNKILDIVWAADTASYNNISLYPNVTTTDARNPYSSDYRIRGVGYINNDIVLFYSSFIHRNLIVDLLKEDPNNSSRYIRISILYKLDYNIDPNVRFTVLCRYENSAVIKAYFAEKSLGDIDINPLRYLNIAPNTVNGVVQESTLQGSYTRYLTKPNSGIDMLGHVYAGHLEAPTLVTSNLNGNLRSGVYQYAIRYVNEAGNKTIISDLSHTIAISKSNFTTTRSLKGDQTTGDYKEYNSNKGIQIRFISNMGYTHVEIIRIWYSNFVTYPAVYLVGRLKSTNGVMYFNDTVFEEVIDTLNYAEINAAPILYYPKAIASKDNRLFIGNIKEKMFDLDIDMRAYQFNEDQESHLYDESLSNHITVTNADFVNDAEAVPLNHDVVNKSNILDEDFNIAKPYRFKRDGSTLGADGLHISLDFELKTLNINENNNEYWSSNLGLSNSEYHLGKKKLFQADEVYRYGIVFRNTYGQVSPVKYIGDFRMPRYDDIYGSSQMDIGTTVKFFVPKFTLNLGGTEAEGLEYKIVYVKRETMDRTVITEGLATTMMEQDSDKPEFYRRPSLFMYDDFKLHIVNNDAQISKGGFRDDWLGNIWGFISPEVLYNKNTSFDGCYAEFIGDVNDSSYILTEDLSTKALNSASGNGDGYPEHPLHIFRYFRPSSVRLYSRSSQFRESILENKIAMSNEGCSIGGAYVGKYGIIHGNVINENKELNLYGLSATTHYFRIGNNLYLSGDRDEKHFPYIRIRKAVVQYGGRSYEKRNSNVYISASNFTSGDSAAVYCDYGDTFYSMFEYNRTQYPIENFDNNADPNDEPYWRGAAEVVALPVQSSINTNFVVNNTYNYLTGGIYSKLKAMQLREEGLGYFQSTACFYYNPAGGDALAASQEGVFTEQLPLYTYNSVYSINNKANLYVARPVDYLRDTRFPFRIRYSDEKSNGEFKDSWLDYRIADFKDMDTAYGFLNYLYVFNDKLFAWQDSSFALISVNPRVQVPASDGTEMLIGTGAVLERIIYISSDIGIQGINEAFSSLSYMYWADINKKKVYRFGQGLEALSDTKLMASWFKNTLTRNSLFIGVYDNSRKSVFMTVVNYVGNQIDLDEFEVTSINPLIITGDTSNIIMRENLNYGLTQGVNSGEYTLVSLENNSLTFNKVYGDDLALGFIDLRKYLKYYKTYTLVFDEKLDYFKGFERFIPTLYLKGTKQFFSVPDDNVIFEHNVGNIREFYGVVYPLILDIIVNKEPLINKAFSALEIENTAMLNNKEYEDALDYTGAENITFSEVAAKSKREVTEFLPLLTKNGQLPTEQINSEYTDNIDNDLYTDPTTNRVLFDTNGIRVVPYPEYLYNIRMTLNKFRTVLPRVRTGILDSNYLNPMDSNTNKEITELLRGTSALIRLIYYGSNNYQLRVRSIVTYFNTSIDK